MLRELKETMEHAANKIQENKSRNEKNTNKNVRTEKCGRKDKNFIGKTSGTEKQLLRTKSLISKMKFRKTPENRLQTQKGFKRQQRSFLDDQGICTTQGPNTPKTPNTPNE